MIRTLGKHIKGYVTASILTPLCMLAEVVVENFIPLLMSVIIDSIGTRRFKENLHYISHNAFTCPCRSHYRFWWRSIRC